MNEWQHKAETLDGVRCESVFKPFSLWIDERKLMKLIKDIEEFTTQTIHGQQTQMHVNEQSQNVS